MSDSSKKPDFDVMISKTVVKNGDSKVFYTNIGAGWKVKSEGISLSLDCIPVDGNMVLFPRKEKIKESAPETKATAS